MLCAAVLLGGRAATVDGIMVFTASKRLGAGLCAGRCSRGSQRRPRVLRLSFVRTCEAAAADARRATPASPLIAAAPHPNITSPPTDASLGVRQRTVEVEARLQWGARAPSPVKSKADSATGRWVPPRRAAAGAWRASLGRRCRAPPHALLRCLFAFPAPPTPADSHHWCLVPCRLDLHPSQWTGADEPYPPPP